MCILNSLLAQRQPKLSFSTATLVLSLSVAFWIIMSKCDFFVSLAEILYDWKRQEKNIVESVKD